MWFYDGTTQLDSGPINMSSGEAQITASTLAPGAHKITAVYSGDAENTAATSVAVIETIEVPSITIGAQGGGTVPSQTASPGGQASYALAINPPAGTTFPSPVTFTVSGLPTGATATFSPASIPANSGQTNVTLTVSIPGQSAALQTPPSELGGGLLPMALGFLLLPFAGRMRRRARHWKGILCLLTLTTAGAVSIAILSGCGSSHTSMGGGGSNPQPQSYTLTITATSGSLTQSVTTTLTVQ